MTLSRAGRILFRSTVSLATAYFVLLVFPEPLFAHVETHGEITFYSRAPLPSGLAPIAAEAISRVRASPLYTPGIRHRVFITGSAGLHAFFNGPYRRAIARNVEIGHAIFVPRLDVAGGRIIHFDGRATAAAPILAHEIMHTFVQRRVGVLGSWQLAWWQREGYPEYIGSRGATELDSPPAYRQAALRWKALLEDRHLTFDQIITRTDP
jgi:hypothetical protein